MHGWYLCWLVGAEHPMLRFIWNGDAYACHPLDFLARPETLDDINDKDRKLLHSIRTYAVYKGPIDSYARFEKVVLPADLVPPFPTIG